MFLSKLPLDTNIDSTVYESILERSFFERYARGRDVWTEEEAMGFAPQLLLSELKMNSRVLDLGAGAGTDTDLFLRAGHSVQALDLYRHPSWAERPKYYGKRVRFDQVPVLEWETDLHFDGVLDNGCFHHQHPGGYIGYLKKVRSLLKPSGVFVLSVFTPSNPEETKGFFTEIDEGRLNRYFAESELRDLFAEANISWKGATRVSRPINGLFYCIARGVRHD